MYPSLIDFP